MGLASKRKKNKDLDEQISTKKVKEFQCMFEVETFELSQR